MGQQANGRQFIMEIKSLEAEIARAQRRLDRIGKRQIPFATALAITRTAKQVKAAEQDEMRRVFDNPTRFTLRGVFNTTAKKKDPTAVVWLKNASFKGGAAETYLRPQITGGSSRPLKRFEKHLQAKGILPKGMYAIPGDGFKLNKYGNPTPGRIMKILSALQATHDPYQRSKQYGKGGIFVARIKGTLGVWQRYGRKGSRIKPLLIFVSKVRYKPIYHFHEEADQEASRVFPGEFEKALRHALATAK